MDALGRWLAGHLPTSPSPTLLHNDYTLDNLMVAPTDIIVQRYARRSGRDVANINFYETFAL